jgi:signal transduction histidine kinase
VRGESDEPRARSARGRRLHGVAPRAAAPQRERPSELPQAGVIARAALRDLQRLLSETTQRLRRATGCACAAAWALRSDGSPYLAGADWSGETPGEPDADAFARIGALRGATQLSEPDSGPELRELARRLRIDAAAPVRCEPGATLAVLVLAGPLRPRALAALDFAAHRLEGPLAAALALGRLEQLDTSVRRLDRLAALGELAAEIAHEVRNPLVTLQTFLQLLPERREDPEFLSRYLAVVTGELRRMDRLLDRVVETARPPRPEDEAAAEVAATLEAVGELLQQRALTRDVELALEAPSGVRVALGEDALRQVLLNLVQNALDATPAGGRIRARAERGDGQVWLRVADSGPGIPEPLRQRIFEPFFTTRPDRAGGLGLAISRRIAEEAGGQLELEPPQPDARGSVFVLRLPMAN